MLVMRIHGMKLVSAANSSEHWRTRWKRCKSQTEELHLMHGAKIAAVQLPAEVFMYRIGRSLDRDNLTIAFKHIRDYLATQMLPTHAQANQHGRRGDDSDPRISWCYGQRLGPPAVEIVITPLELKV